MLSEYGLRQSVERARSLVAFAGWEGKAALLAVEDAMYHQRWDVVPPLLDVFWGEYVNYPHRLERATYQLRKARKLARLEEPKHITIGDVEISYVPGEHRADSGYCFYNTRTGTYRSAPAKTAKEWIIQLQQA